MHDHTSAQQYAQSLILAYLDLAKNAALWHEDHHSILELVLEKTAHTLDVGMVAIWRLNQGGTCLELEAQYVQNGQVSSNINLELEDYPRYFKALKSERIIAADSAATDPRTQELVQPLLIPEGITSLLDVSLLRRGRIDGVICIQHRGEARHWTTTEQQFVTAIADFITQIRLLDESKASEEKFQRLSSYQQAILDAANYSIISTDTEGTITTFNAGAEKLLGYSADEVIGKRSPVAFHDPKEIHQYAEFLSNELMTPVRPDFDAFVAKCANGKPDENTWTYIHKNGSKIPVLLSVSAILDAQNYITGFLSIAVDISDKQAASKALSETEHRYRILFESSVDSIFLMKNDCFIDCNTTALTMFNCSREQIIGHTPAQFSPSHQPDGSESYPKAIKKIRSALMGEHQFFEWQHCQYDGTRFDAEVSLSNLTLNDELHLLATVRDISNRKKNQRALEQYSQALVDKNQTLTLFNTMSERLHSCSTLSDIVHTTKNALYNLKEFWGISFHTLDDGATEFTLVGFSGFDQDIIELTQKSNKKLPLKNSLNGIAVQTRKIQFIKDLSTDKRYHPVFRDAFLKKNIKSLVAIPLVASDQALGCIQLVYKAETTPDNLDLETFAAVARIVALSMLNIQQMKELEHLATHDALTNLPNRLLLHRSFKELIPFETEQTTQAVLFLLDLDRFKEINDTLGHKAGDDVLCQLGKRLCEWVYQYPGLVCRLGGDEFAVLITELLDSEQQIEILASEISQLMKEPFIVDSNKLELGVSIGSAIFPDHGKDSHELLRSADVAMYQAKSLNLVHRIYSNLEDRYSLHRLTVMNDMSSGLQHNQFSLYYQPKLDLESQKVIGFEALIRWFHPKMGQIAPDDFIPLAEMGDSIHTLTDKVLEMAFTQLQTWKKEQLAFSLAVNLSARNLMDATFVDRLKKMIQAFEIDTHYLEFELTETALMQNPNLAIKCLHDIAHLGIQISVDDYGTGYSSLSYLKRLPINTLKIDRTFISDMLKDEQDAIIVQSTVALAHNLGLKVVAEGVEDADTLNQLKSLGCNEVQGYYLHRPAPWAEIQKWLRHD